MTYKPCRASLEVPLHIVMTCLEYCAWHLCTRRLLQPHCTVCCGLSGGIKGTLLRILSPFFNPSKNVHSNLMSALYSAMSSHPIPCRLAAKTSPLLLLLRRRLDKSFLKPQCELMYPPQSPWDWLFSESIPSHSFVNVILFLSFRTATSPICLVVGEPEKATPSIPGCHLPATILPLVTDECTLRLLDWVRDIGGAMP